MRTICDAQSLAATLAAILEADRCILFAGAGVAARAGLPVWGSYLEQLAEVVESYEAMLARLIRKRILEGSLLLAAHYYKTCTEIPVGEKLAKLSEPFQSGRYNPERLVPLVRLPFTSIVTTNYDRSLHDAYASAHKVAALPVEL
jgi:hypothetical protein